MTDISQPQIESIGERLRKARLKKKVTIDEAYKETKIHPKVLTALEEDKYEEFLSPIYAKAFIKSYCRYLGLDADRILKDYDSLRKEAPKPTLELKRGQKYINIDRLKKWALPAGAGLLGIFLSIFLVILVSRAVVKVKNIKIFKPKAAIEKTTAQESAFLKPLSIPQDQPLALIVKTKGDVWLEVKCDGKFMLRNVLKKGSVEAYKADDNIQIWTGKAEFLDLVLNSNPLGSPGSGVIRKIVLTRKGLKIEKK